MSEDRIERIADQLDNEGFDDSADYVRELKASHDALLDRLKVANHRINLCELELSGEGYSSSIDNEVIAKAESLK